MLLLGGGTLLLSELLAGEGAGVKDELLLLLVDELKLSEAEEGALAVEAEVFGLALGTGVVVLLTGLGVVPGEGVSVVSAAVASVAAATSSSSRSSSRRR